MKVQTTAHWQVKDFERAKQWVLRHLAFDPAFYEATFPGSHEDDSTGFNNPGLSPATTTGTRVRVIFKSSTEAIPQKTIKQWVQKVGASGISTDVRGRYTIKPYLGSEGEETLPTTGPERSLSELIDQFRRHPKIGFAKRIAARLDYLLKVSREEQPWQAPPAAASLESFLAFLSKNPGLAYPDVVLTPAGNVRARWGCGPAQHFALEFLEDKDVRFVVFAPDPRQTYKTVRVSGIATVDSVMELTAPYRILEWVKDGGAQAA